MGQWVPALQTPDGLARLEEYVWEVWDISAHRGVDDYRMDGETYILHYVPLAGHMWMYPPLDGARNVIYITETPREVMSWLIRLSSSPLV
jgi:hypothetical protein